MINHSYTSSMENDSVAQSEAKNVSSSGHLVDIKRNVRLTYYNLLLRHLLMAKDRDKDSRKLETVLVMQGGGSLGAYECGVYKALSKHGKKFDIVAGTSIGAINAAILLLVSQITILQRSLRNSG